MVCMLMTLRWHNNSMASISFSLYFKNSIGISDDGSFTPHDCLKANFNPSQTNFTVLIYLQRIWKEYMLHHYPCSQ